MDLSSSQELLLWLGAAGMTLGAIIIAVVGFGLASAERHHVTASFFVCAIAATAYTAMATGLGNVMVNDQPVFYARYVDWVATTPLLLLGLLIIGLWKGNADSGTRNGLIGFVIGADVMMIVTGLVASLRIGQADRWLWYAISCFFFLLVLWAIWGPVRKHLGPHKALYGRLLGILTVLWLIYPVLWVLGTEGLDIIGLTGEIAVFAVIDVLAKAGFGIVLVLGVRSATRTPAAA
jgi:bacteriorhodopsin